MRRYDNLRARLLVGCAVFLMTAACLQGQQDNGFPVQAQRQVVSYLSQLANMHCKETVTQEKLSPTGHVLATERSTFDYLIMMEGDSDGFQLNESRIESGKAEHKPLPMLVTNGFSTMLLIFHPYYSGSFAFETGPEETLNGVTAVPIHFTQIHGKRALAALAVRDRQYPLELTGTAWLEKETGQVLRINAELGESMSDVGLSSMKIHVDYQPVRLPGIKGVLTLPSSAEVEVTTPRQRWRNTHSFSEYKVFGIDAVQDPNVKVRASNDTAPNGGVTSESTDPNVNPTTARKEKP